jgi:hypothetical protein
MKREETGFTQQASRWLRVGALTLTTIGPAVNTLLAWMRQRSQSVSERSDDLQESAHDARVAALQQLDDFTQASRQRVAEQANYLQRQAQQLSAQAKRLRGSLRKEQRQRRKLNKALKELRKAGLDWSQELLKRGENLTEDLVAQGGKISSDLLERGSELSHDLTERGGKITQGLAERGGQLTQVLVKRGSEVGQDLAKRSSALGQDLAGRGGQMLQSTAARKRNNTFWMIFGFSTGLVVAVTVTYLFLRQRIQRDEREQNQQIELASDASRKGKVTERPAGTIRHLDSTSSSVATLQTVDIEHKVVAPADAAFVGVMSTKQYYPVATAVEAKDLIYFTSEAEAEDQGFTAAE